MEEANISVSTSDQITLSQRGYTLKKKLNEGSYAKVYLTEYKKPDKTSTLACKVINTQVAPEDFVKKFLPREIAMLMKLSHPHIVPIFSIFQRRHKYFIFMRLMEQGDMLEYVIHNGRVVEDQARIWLRQLALAIQYMHELEIAHRDIKCENVLITNNLNVKLSDFGFSRSCVDKRLKAVYSETYCGSLSYTAPEILHGRPYAPKPTDVWSLGVVLFVILNRSMPFSDKELKALYVAQMAKKWAFRTRHADTLSNRCIEITTQMMEPLVSQRVKINDVVNSAWIAMDARLKVMSNPEKSALQKAQKEKADIIKKLNENSYPSSDDTEGTFNISSI